MKIAGTKGERKMRGKLYGIGVGPGDPELLTLKAKRILEAADVVAVPVKEKGEQSTALEIIRPVVSLDDKELLEVVFRMAKDEEERKRCRAEAGKQLTDILDQGKKLLTAQTRQHQVQEDQVRAVRGEIHECFSSRVCPCCPEFLL